MKLTPPMDTGVTKAVFHQKLEGRPGPFVRSVYDVLDEFNACKPREMGIRLACRPGCTACCMQLASCHNAEWDLIEQLLLNETGKMPRQFRRQLRKQLEKAASDYAKAYPVEIVLPSLDRVLKDWFGKPCPFLLDKKCAVYPVRPLLCRIVSSTTRCSSTIGGGSRQSRFDYESEAVILVQKHAARGGVAPTTPLHGHIERLLAEHPKVLKEGSGPPA